MDDSIAGQWWLPYRRTPLWQMRKARIEKTTINQEKAQQSENHSAAQYSDNNC